MSSCFETTRFLVAGLVAVAIGTFACGGGGGGTDAGNDGVEPADVADPGPALDPGGSENPGEPSDATPSEDPGPTDDPGTAGDGLQGDSETPEDVSDVPSTDTGTPDASEDVSQTDPWTIPAPFESGGPLVLVDQDFDALAAGPIGSPWAVMMTGGSASVTAMPAKSAGGQVLMVVDGDGETDYGNVFLSMPQAPALLDGQDLELSFDIRLPDQSPQFTRVVLTNGASSASDLGVVFENRGVWAAYGRESLWCKGSVPALEWQSIQMTYRHSSRTVTLRINDAATNCTDSPLEPPEELAPPNRLLLAFAGVLGGQGPVGGTFLFDNFKLLRHAPGWIVDPVRGKLWALSQPEAPLNQADAATYCGALDLGPHGNWRLPSIEDLRALVVDCATTAEGGACGIEDLCTDPDLCGGPECEGCASNGGGIHGCYWPFPGQECGPSLWSSTPSPTGFWGIDYADASVRSSPASELRDVRCVANAGL